MRPDNIPEDAIRETYKCCYCGFPVQTYWSPDDKGMYSSSKYLLLGDAVAHGFCFDKSIEEYYKMEEERQNDTMA
jgi:hypothetical protein